MKTRLMPETLYLVMYDGYSSDVHVAFTSKDKADAHAEEVGGFVQPVIRMNRKPKSRIRIMYHTVIDAKGLVKRTDLHEIIEWEYEPGYQRDVRTASTVSKHDFAPYETVVFTFGYDHLDVKRLHEKTVKENGGIEL